MTVSVIQTSCTAKGGEPARFDIAWDECHVCVVLGHACEFGHVCELACEFGHVCELGYELGHACELHVCELALDWNGVMFALSLDMFVNLSMFVNLL